MVPSFLLTSAQGQKCEAVRALHHHPKFLWGAVRWPYMDASHSLHLKIHVKCITINAHVLEIKQELLNIGDPILTGSQASPGHKRCHASLESEAEVIPKLK